MPSECRCQLGDTDLAFNRFLVIVKFLPCRSREFQDVNSNLSIKVRGIGVISKVLNKWKIFPKGINSTQ